MKGKLYYILLIFATICACEKLDTSMPEQSAAVNEPSSDTTVTHPTSYSVDDILNGEITDAFNKNSDTTFIRVWLRGYIVGYVGGTKLSSAIFDAGNKMTNILLADSPLETNFENCIPVQLTTSSAANKQVREALNLSNHPGNLKKKVEIYGDLIYYMSAIGMKNVTKYMFLPDDFDYNNPPKEPDINDENKEDNGDDNEQTNKDDKEDNGNGENTDDNNKEDNNPNGNEDSDDSILGIEIYSVTDVLGPLTNYFIVHNVASISNCLVKGYIVGYIRKNNISHTAFGLGNPIESNIVLADSPEEKDYNNCIAVQLTTGSTYIQAREALNLKDHPENFHRCVIVEGSIQKYMGALGVKNTKGYTFLE